MNLLEDKERSSSNGRSHALDPYYRSTIKAVWRQEFYKLCFVPFTTCLDVTFTTPH